jgi:hypothetical protein
MRNAPCYGCTRRSLICHAQCPDYPAWVAEQKAERAAKRKTADADAHTAAVIERNLRRGKHKQRRGQR